MDVNSKGHHSAEASPAACSAGGQSEIGDLEQTFVNSRMQL